MHKQKLAFSLFSKEWGCLVQDQIYKFVWIYHVEQAKALTCTLQMQNIVDRKVPSWHYICHLHMDTKVLECCMVTDIRTILDYAVNLVMYSDFHSVHWHRYDKVPDPQCTPEQMFKMLMHPRIS